MTASPQRGLSAEAPAGAPAPAGGRPGPIALWLLGALWLAACSAIDLHIQPAAQFPPPRVEPAAASAGLYLDEAQRDFAYSSTESKHYHWHMDIGAAQVALFEVVIQGLFERAQTLDTLAACASCDVIVAPRLLSVQFTTPDNGPNPLYEVWLSYRIALLSPDGQTVRRLWPVTAYGQAPERMGRKVGMRLALQRALRDTGALLVSGLANAQDALRTPAP